MIGSISNKKYILLYAGAIATLVISASLIFNAIAGPKLEYARLEISRYDMNIIWSSDRNDPSNIIRCPLPQEEEKRLGFVTLTLDDLNKVPKLKQAIDDVEASLEDAIKRGYREYSAMVDREGNVIENKPWRYYYWIKDENGCYNDMWHTLGLLQEQPVVGGTAVATLTEDEYKAIKSMIYNAYRTQYTQEELNRLAELYKGFRPSDPSVNATPTDLLESQMVTKDYADMSSAYLGFFTALIKVDGKYYGIAISTLNK
ncbi:MULTISPECIES: hypothetical protein [Candidatus Nitrosocaldus]|nr:MULTISPECIES: hypothetical protein [Candidatus Nitrosocaldus]